MCSTAVQPQMFPAQLMCRSDIDSVRYLSSLTMLHIFHRMHVLNRYIRIHRIVIYKNVQEY